MKETISPESINKIADYIIKKRMEVPAVLFLEVNKPLALFNGAAVTVSIPFLGAVFQADKLQLLSKIVSDRNNIEALIKAIETRSKKE